MLLALPLSMIAVGKCIILQCNEANLFCVGISDSTLVIRYSFRDNFEKMYRQFGIVFNLLNFSLFFVLYQNVLIVGEIMASVYF